MILADPSIVYLSDTYTAAAIKYNNVDVKNRSEGIVRVWVFRHA